MVWIMRHPQADIDMLGYIPYFLAEDDPRPAREQFDDRYAPGGGWRPLGGFTLDKNGSLLYPGDPPLGCLAQTVLHNNTCKSEIILVYEHAWVAIIQSNGDFEVARMD
jgi:hypothetical protein